eukprot:281260_1
MGTMCMSMRTRMNMWRHRQKHVTSKTYSGGGYSIGSFSGNTMVRRNSTDDEEEEEDPFQGQTMYRAPNVDSPHGPSVLLTDEKDNDSNDNSVNIANDNDTVTSMGTKPAMSVSPKNAFIAPNGTMHMVSDDCEYKSIGFVIKCV